MDNTVINISDNITQVDALAPVRVKHPSPYTRTRVIGVDEFGNKLFNEENQVVLGGSLFTLEKVWGVQSSLNVDTLNQIMGIATTGAPVLNKNETFVCLFGLGYGGCGDTIKSVKDVKYYEREVFDMVPFRVTDQPLTSEEATQYFFKKDSENGRTAYYLKKFEKAPKIHSLWKDGPQDEDGSIVEDGVHNTTRTEPIETFIEMHLKISKNDIREYFELTGGIEEARINSIGLFTGVLCDLGNGNFDFKDVTLFSKLNIPNESLVISKTMDIYYRVYAS